MNDAVVAGVDRDMIDLGILSKHHQITGRNRTPLGGQGHSDLRLLARRARQRDTLPRKHILSEARAIESAWSSAAPHVGYTNEQNRRAQHASRTRGNSRRCGIWY